MRRGCHPGDAVHDTTVAETRQALPPAGAAGGPAADTPDSTKAHDEREPSCCLDVSPDRAAGSAPGGAMRPREAGSAYAWAASGTGATPSCCIRSMLSI